MRRAGKWVIVIPLVMVLFFSVVNHPALGSPAESRRRAEESRREVETLQNAVKALDESIARRERRTLELEIELKETARQLALTTKQLEESEARLSVHTRSFAGRVRSAYMKGGLSYLEVLLEAESFGDIITQIFYLSRILTRDSELITAIRTEKDLMQEKKENMEKFLESIEDLRFQAARERENILAEKKNLETMLAAAQGRLAVELAKIMPQAEREPVYAVVFDNAPGARPQHGLSRAHVVYEYEVEGRVTRYLGLFANFPAKVGPIRSGRYHNAQLAYENRVHFIYASAGRDVLNYIRELDMEHTNALVSKSPHFFRDPARNAPHNLYVNLREVNLAQASTAVVIRPAYLAREGAEAGRIVLRYSADYVVSYEYDEDKGAYRRYINGQPHRDAAGGVIYARNIFIQYTPHGLDAIGRPLPRLVGEGALDYYALGQHFRGRWKKESESSPTRFFYEDGQEIERIYGQTWIQIARP